MVKVPMQPQNMLVEVVQGSVAEPHKTLGRKEDEPGERRPGAVLVRCCAPRGASASAAKRELAGRWAPILAAISTRPCGRGAEGRCSRGWKCAAGSPPAPVPRDVPARGAGLHTNLCFADMPSAPHSRPCLPPRHGHPLLILARSGGLRCQFTPTCAIRPGTWWQGLGRVTRPLRQSLH